MRHKEQAAGLVRILLAEALIIQRRDHRFAGTGGNHHQIACIATDSALRLQLVQNLLLIGIGMDVHGVGVGIVGVKVFFRLQRTGQTLLLPLIVILELAVIPVIFEGCCNFVDGFRQVTLCHLGIPFKTAGQCGIGQIG